MFRKQMKRSFARAALAGLMICLGAAHFDIAGAQVTSTTIQTDGVLCVLQNGGRLKLQVCAGNIIRVVYTMATTIPAPQGMIVGTTTFTPGTWTPTITAAAVTVTTPVMSATVNTTTALVSFANAAGTTVGSETARTLTGVTKSGQAGYSGTLYFNSPNGEGVYGLGNLSMGAPGWGNGGGSWWEANPPDRSGQLNGRGYTFDMHQANWYDVIPFFMTTSGYGVLMNFLCHATKTSPLNFSADFLLNGAWDYFFIYGPQFDTIIKGYRDVCGPAPMPPKWALGWWQCKNRYQSSAEINTVVTTYRNDNLPIDCIVQDWSWWTAYGSFTWAAAYANPATWIGTIHNNNCHFALSIWPTFVAGTPNYTQMTGHFITVACNSVTAGNFMDPFDPTAMGWFWSYMAPLYNNGVDGWWMDASEPECPQLTNQTTPSGAVELYANAYSLAHAQNIYVNQRAVSTAKRVVNLTRSFNAGQYRFGTYYWNGDLSSSSMTNVPCTVSGGLNSSMAGNPYWCSDIGGFQTGNTGTATDEILTRWFEAGTFFPIFRVHGSRPTEIYNMNAAPRATCSMYLNMRYRLLPYIYSLAWKVTHEGYTMTRALPFDYRTDANVYNIADQYMFGPALLINPVTTTGATTRNVYLPAGTWYNYWTGATTVSTGQTVNNVAAPLTMIPIYARAGSIVPLGPRIQYATQSVDPIELRVYTGADGSFTLYEDQGDSYAYETGSYATIPMSFSNATGKVTIGARSGAFPGMVANRTFNIVFVTANHGIGDTITTPDCVVNYTGAAMTACPATPVGVCAECAKRQKMMKVEPFTVKTVEERVAFPAYYTGEVKEVSVYDMTGRLLQKAVFTKQAISLRKDFGLSSGIYIVKVRMVP